MKSALSTDRRSPTFISLGHGTLQALVNPMTIDQKNRFFQTLLKCGFKEIEAGFPSASQTEFDFIRGLIEKDELPDDVWLQVSSGSSSPVWLALCSAVSPELAPKPGLASELELLARADPVTTTRPLAGPLARS